MTTVPSGSEPQQESTPDEQAKRDLAMHRVKARRDLSAHVVVYVVVNAFLVGIWWFNGGGYFWPGWVLAGWGIGLVLNIWDVLFRRPITEADVEREMRRL